MAKSKKKRKRRLKIKNIIILLGIISAIFVFFYYVLKLPIKNIYIKGNEIVTDDEIIQDSFISEYPSFLLTNSRKIQKELEKNSYIEKVNVRKKLGNVIEIAIDEYIPLALDVGGLVILENGNKQENIYELTDIPIFINSIDDADIYANFIKKFARVKQNIKRQISQIEYSPVPVDNERFLLYMSDGNLIYITLTKVTKLNKYNQIKDRLAGGMGIIYLDSGDYVELKNS